MRGEPVLVHPVRLEALRSSSARHPQGMPSRAIEPSRVTTALGALKIAHRTQLRDSAVAPRALRIAVERVIRRDWVATPDCDPALVRAVHAGATLACVSAAAVHGLWQLDFDSLHLSAARSTARIDRSPPPWPEFGDAELTVHWTRDPEPQLAPRVRAVITSVPRTLLDVAACQPLEPAVAVIDSALRRQKITMHELRELAGRHPALTRVLAHVDASSDAETESLARVRLARRGVVMVPQVVIDGHPVDGLIGSRLVLQIDGYGPHSSRAQRNRDLKQDDRLRRRGFIVLRYSGDQVRWQWAMVESAVLGIVAAGKHLGT
jgi:very-short-patch-repair endonuclease